MLVTNRLLSLCLQSCYTSVPDNINNSLRTAGSGWFLCSIFTLIRTSILVNLVKLREYMKYIFETQINNNWFTNTNKNAFYTGKWGMWDSLYYIINKTVCQLSVTSKLYSYKSFQLMLQGYGRMIRPSYIWNIQLFHI